MLQANLSYVEVQPPRPGMIWSVPPRYRNRNDCNGTVHAVRKVADYAGYFGIKRFSSITQHSVIDAGWQIEFKEWRTKRNLKET